MCQLDHGCHVVGPCASLNSALEAARASRFDIALLDVNLQGGKIYPVTKLLEERKVRFLIMSADKEAEAANVGMKWRTCPKPFKFAELRKMMLEVLVRA